MERDSEVVRRICRSRAVSGLLSRKYLRVRVSLLRCIFAYFGRKGPVENKQIRAKADVENGHLSDLTKCTLLEELIKPGRRFQHRRIYWKGAAFKLLKVS